MNIVDTRHPDYYLLNADWDKWRLTYQSGRNFLNRYLKPFSSRENSDNFNLRSSISYVPAFAKAAVNDIKNAIYQRSIDIIRYGGPASYQHAIAGEDGGVDLLGSTMSFFIGQSILPELLPMGKVGIYVDAPRLNGPTKLDKGNAHPYIYRYPIEDILNWSYLDPDNFQAVLLRDHDFQVDEASGLPTNRITKYRYLYLDNKGLVNVIFYDETGNEVDRQQLGINRIPFFIGDSGESLIADVCDYQIALMNIESSDIGYVLLSNFPFYVEEFDPLGQPLYNKGSEDDELEVGINQGRRYPKGLNQPAFINPSPDPLRASMEKEDQLKRDIRALVNMTVANLAPKMASAESKAMDMVGLEAGLSYIGLVLQNLESRIGEFWSLYESSEPPTIIYPTEYSLPDQATTDAKIDKCLEVMEKVNSVTLRRALAKRVARLIVGSRVPALTLAQIDDELDQVGIIYADAKTIVNDVINGILSPEYAAKARGYPDDSVMKAQEFQAKRVAIIQAAQSTTPIDAASRGIKDLSLDPNQSKSEKVNADGTPKPQRGEAL